MNKNNITKSRIQRYDIHFDKELCTRKDLCEFLKGFREKYMDKTVNFKFKNIEYNISMTESHRGVLTGYMLTSYNESNLVIDTECCFKRISDVIKKICNNGDIV